MQVQLETTGGLNRKVRVQLPVEQLNTATSSRLKRIAARAKVPGFRPGKAPFKLIEAQYGDSARWDAVNDLINDTLPKALQEAKVEPAGRPRVEVSSIENGVDYNLLFDVIPEITLDIAGKINVNRPQVEITDGDIDRLIDNLKKARKTFANRDGAAEAGDKVTVDFVGKLDGEAFAGGSASDSTIEIGSGRFLPDLENGIVGHKAGDQFTVDVAFPADYRAENLAGKTAQFDVTLKSVEQAVLPNAEDAEFLTAHGATDSASLREKSRTALENERNRAVRNRVKSQVLDQLLAANTIDVPASMVDEEIGRLREEAINRMNVAKIPDEKKAELFPANLFEANAKRRVALGLLISEVIKSKDIKLDPARVETSLKDLAADYEDPTEVHQYYHSRPELMQGLRAVVMEEQVVEALLADGAVTDAPMTLEALLNPSAA